jgi:hypothetical protein
MSQVPAPAPHCAALLAVAAVVAWLVHSRERRRRREAVRFRVSPYRLPIDEKSLLKNPRRPYRRAESNGGVMRVGRCMRYGGM